MSDPIDYSDPLQAACAAYAKEVDGSCFAHAMKAAITAYYAALPSDYSSIIKWLRVMSDDPLEDGETWRKSAQAADAIEELSANLYVLVQQHDEWKARAEAAEAERDAMEKAGIEMTDRFVAKIDDLKAERDVLRERVDDLEVALHKIQQWAEAYPIDVFPEPTEEEMAAAQSALGGAVHGSWARHITEGMKEIARAALKAESPK